MRELNEWEAGKNLLEAVREAKAALETCHIPYSEKELMLAIVIMLKELQRMIEK